MCEDLKFNKTEATDWNLFKAKCKLLYRMLMAERFIYIEVNEDKETEVLNIQPVAFNSTIEEMNWITREIHICTTDVVYGDVSQAVKIMKRLHADNNLTLSN